MIEALEAARRQMIGQQVRSWDVLDARVLEALAAVPRERFVPEAYRGVAFADTEIPLGHGQFMLPPKVEGRILQALAPARGERVLEVGTGSGYLTALLAHRAAHVYSVEIRPSLAEFGRSNLARHGRTNVTVEVGDAACGYPKHAPYDVIVLTGSTPLVPQSLLENVAPGGRLFAVVGEPPVMTATIFHCAAAGAFRAAELFETMLAPLVNCVRPGRFRF